MVRGIVDGQKLQLTQETLAGDTIAYITAQFLFSPDWWNHRKFAHFINGNTHYMIMLDDHDSIPASAQVNLSAGIWTVYLHGNYFTDGELAQRITTTKATLYVMETGDLSGGVIPPLPPTVLEQILALIGNMDELDTEDKTNLVAAINEAYSREAGTSDHAELINRDAADQHPMSAITGLLVTLAAKYSKPALGIPKSDLEDTVRISLGLADTALQSVPSTYRTAAAQDDIDGGLQSQIDALVSKSDVVDVVGTYAELIAYDTSTLGENDVVKVLDDSTHSNARSYYRWTGTEWEYVGSEAVGYTKAEEDTLLNAKYDASNPSGYQTSAQVDAAITGKNYQTRTISDVGGYYTADTVEAALQEIGAELSGVNTLLGSGVIA